jgi:magnesium chelatase subunit D
VSAPADAWIRARLALDLLGIDPSGLGGLRLLARAGPVRDRFLAAVPRALAPRPCRRLPPGVSDEALFGGVDPLGTLAAGALVRTHGLLGVEPVTLILPMAERATESLAARLATTIEAGNCIVALDEGAGTDAALPPALAERLALHLDLDGLPQGACPDLDETDLRAARALLRGVRAGSSAIAALTGLAAELGISSLRAPWLALRVARSAAARESRAEVSEADLLVAATLVLGPRAVTVPPDHPGDELPPPPEECPREDGSTPDPVPGLIHDVLLEAAKAVLPKNMLERLATDANSAARGGSGGARRRGNRRGRPLSARVGPLDGAARIDLVATLRAAAPWQLLRRRARPPDRSLLIARDDIRVRRFEEHSDRLLILSVDASGSAAAARLAEAKGACELLLEEAYVRRDNVALIAFRGMKAELLLPPTRSLLQVKRRLSALAGGGSTPLASGLRAALDAAEAARARGLTPALAVLTDGRANVGLDGIAHRETAGADALLMARALSARRIPAVVIDMGQRPQRQLAELAAAMRAVYQALPRADARHISASISAAFTAR